MAKSSQSFGTDAADRRRELPKREKPKPPVLTRRREIEKPKPVLRTYKDKPRTPSHDVPRPKPKAPTRQRTIGAGRIPKGRTRTTGARPTKRGGYDFGDIAGDILDIDRGARQITKIVAPALGKAGVGYVKQRLVDIKEAAQPGGTMEQYARQGRNPLEALALAIGEPAAKEAIVGPDLWNTLTGRGKAGKGGLVFDVAMLPFVFARPFRGARAAVDAARSIHEGPQAAKAAFNKTMGGQSIIRGIRQNALLNKTPERDFVHLALDDLAGNKELADHMKDQVDSEVYTVLKKVPKGQREEAAKVAYRDMYEKIDDALKDAATHPVPDFHPVVKPEEAEAHLRQFTNPKNIGKGHSVNEPHVSRLEGGGGYQLIGGIEPVEWVNRTLHAVDNDPELGLQLANWYRELGPLFRTFFGEDADAIIRGFAVSQANASPSGGLGNVLQVRDLLLRGKPVPKNKISTVVKSIEAAYQGQPVTKGMQAKLHDFANSLAGKRRRTWTGDDIRGGKPTAVDIHAIRDLGYVDAKILDVLRARHGLPVAHLQLEKLTREVRRLQKQKLPKGWKDSVEEWEAKQAAAIDKAKAKVSDFRAKNRDAIAEGKASGIKMDSWGSAPTDSQYNTALRKYQEVADYLNEIELWGKDNWQPYEVQALGWSAIQRYHGVVPEDAGFAVSRNTTSVALEVLKGKTGIGEALGTHEADLVTRRVVDEILPRLVEEEHGFLTEIKYGLGGYLNDVTPAAQIKIIATADQVDRIVARLAHMFDQWDVWGVRAGVTVSPRKGAGAGKAALEIDAPEFVNPQQVEAFWKALQANVPKGMDQHFQGFSSFTHADGTPGIRVVTEARPVSAAKAETWAKQFDDLITRAGEEAGVDARYTATNVELRRSSVEAKSSKAGRGALRRVQGGTGGRAGVGDPLATEARNLLHEAVEQAQDDSFELARRVHHGSARADAPGLIGRARGALDDLSKAAIVPPHMRPGGLYPKGGVVAKILGEGGEELVAPVKAIGSEIIPTRTTGTLADDVLGHLPEMKKLRRKQDELYSIERRKRLEAYWAAHREAGGGLAGHEAARQVLSGELPKLQFDALKMKGIDPAEVEEIIRHIDEDRPDITGFEAIRTADAIRSVVNGRVPTRSDMKLLEKAFGAEKAAEIDAQVDTWKKIREIGFDLLALPRSLKSSIDVSAGLRQGGLVLASHPIIWTKAHRGTLQGMKGLTPAQLRKASDDIMNEIVLRPTWKQMEDAQVAFTGLDNATTREEAFATNLGDYFPGVGHSAGAYTGFLNRLRADLFDYMLDQGRKQGVDIENDQVFLKATGNIVNNLTGRGSAAGHEMAMRSLAVVFFSPRLIASRLNMLFRAFNPMTYVGAAGLGNASKVRARREAARATMAFFGLGSAVLFLADKLPGVEVGMDPLSSDFGKIKAGPTRVDIWGGFQQYVVLGGRLIAGAKVLSDSGERKDLEAYGKSRIFGTVEDFLSNKFAPSPAYFYAWDMAGAATGQKFDPVKEFLPTLMAPIGVESFAQTGWGVGTDDPGYGVKRAALEFAANFAGLGTNTYGSKPKKPKSLFSGGSGDLFGGSGGKSLFSG